MHLIDKTIEFLKAYGDNKLVLLLAGAFLTLVLQQLLPAIFSIGAKIVKAAGSLIGGRFAHWVFQGRYLDWVVIEQRELKLTGIVASEDVKKPTLEQVYVSLYVGVEHSTLSAPNALPATPEDLGVVKTWEELEELVELHRLRNGEKIPKKILKAARKRFFQDRSEPQDMETLPGLDSGRIEEAAVRTWILGLLGDKLDETLAEFQLRRVVGQQNRIAILGLPGAGKTTLLQYIALTFARERAGEKRLRERGILKRRFGSVKWRLPIVLQLTSIASQLVVEGRVAKPPSLLELMPRLLPPDLQRDSNALQFFERKLDKGACLILLDGLDEVPTQSEFEAVVLAINSLATRYPKNQFIVTSRIAGWRGGIGPDFDIHYVRDLTDEQVGTFIDIWYDAVERNAVAGSLKEESKAERLARERRSRQRAFDLKTTLEEHPGIRRLATNPMLLSIVALVHRSLTAMPRERSTLYSQCARILLEQWDISKRVHVDNTDLTLEQKEALMRRLAFAYHTGEIGDPGGGRDASLLDVQTIIAKILPEMGKEGASVQHLLTRLIERSGLLVERQRGKLSFSHHTFQEYFTALHLASSEQNKSNQFLRQDGILLSDWWREVILLYSGLVSDASDLLRSIYQPELDDICQQRLRLAGLCLGEANSVRDIPVRQNIAQALRRVRARGVCCGKTICLSQEELEYLVGWSKGTDWFPHAAEASVNSKLSEDALDRLQDAIIVGMRETQVFVCRAAIQCISALSKKAVRDDVLDALLSQVNAEDAESRRLAVNALGLITRHGGDDRFRQALIASLESPDPTLGHTALSALIAIASDSESPVSKAIAKRLFPSPSVQLSAERLALLPYFAQDILERDPEALRSLLTALSSHSLWKAIRTLSSTLGADVAKQQLMSKLIDHILTMAGERALELNLLKLIPPNCFDELQLDSLLSLFEHWCDEDSKIVVDVLKALCARFPNQLANRLRLIYVNASECKLVSALDLIAQLPPGHGSEDWIVALADLTQSVVNRQIREASARALAIAAPSAVGLARARALKLCDDNALEIRLAALLTLVKLGTKSLDYNIERRILSMLDDHSETIRCASIIALSHMPGILPDHNILEKALSTFKGALEQKAVCESPLPTRIYKKLFSKQPEDEAEWPLICSAFFAISKMAERSQSSALFDELVEIHLQRPFLVANGHRVPKGLLSVLPRIEDMEFSNGFFADLFDSLQEFLCGSNRIQSIATHVAESEYVTRFILALEKEESDVEDVDSHGIWHSRVAAILSPNVLAKRLLNLINCTDISRQKLAITLLYHSRLSTSSELVPNILVAALNQNDVTVLLAALDVITKLYYQAINEEVFRAILGQLNHMNTEVREAAWVAIQKHKDQACAC